MSKEEDIDLNSSATVFDSFSFIGSNPPLTLIARVMPPSTRNITAVFQHTWRSAILLARYVWLQRHVIIDCHVVELGAGTSLPGLVAANAVGLNGSVVLTDTGEDALERCREACKVNGVTLTPSINAANEDTHRCTNVTVMDLTWGMFSPKLLSMRKPDLLLASDCLYDKKDYDDFFATVAYFLLDRTDISTFPPRLWMAYEERNANQSIEWLVERWGLQCQKLDIGPDTCIVPEEYNDGVVLLEISSP